MQFRRYHRIWSEWRGITVGASTATGRNQASNENALNCRSYCRVSSVRYGDGARERSQIGRSSYFGYGTDPLSDF